MIKTTTNTIKSFETTAAREGTAIDSTFKAVMTPIYMTSIFYQEALGVVSEFEYTRSANPTRNALEVALAKLEGGSGAVATASGMAATSLIFLSLQAGDHVLTQAQMYGGSLRLCGRMRQQHGLEISQLFDINDFEAVRKSIKPNTKLIWIETPSNPLFQIIDLEKLCLQVKAEFPDVLIACDNTMASSYFLKPLALGCDLVMHSSTKYLNGHSDVIGGIVVAKSEELLARLRFTANCFGLTESPFDAWLVLRGLRTLPLRMRAHEENALAVAGYLLASEFVEKVYYPGLVSHPGHEIAKKQMSGFGGTLSFRLKAGAIDLPGFLQMLELFTLSVSLGGVESLIAQPWSMSHGGVPAEEKMATGITPELVRISCGIESQQDLIADLDRAFQACCCCSQ